MANAAEQTQRNLQIAADKAAGLKIPEIATKHSVSPSTVKNALRAAGPVRPVRAGAIKLAEERRAQYAATVRLLEDVADQLPLEQASAKVGAIKALGEALDRLTKFEQDLGHLPRDLRELGDERRLAEVFADVVEIFEVPPEAVAYLKASLDGELWAA